MKGQERKGGKLFGKTRASPVLQKPPSSFFVRRRHKRFNFEVDKNCHPHINTNKQYATETGPKYFLQHFRATVLIVEFKPLYMSF